MIFSFTGAQSTGKTTLLEHLKCTNLGSPSFEFIPEVTRLVKREYEVPINEDGDDMTQMLIMTEHIRNIFKGRTDNLIRGVNKILDRCALDGIVYSHYLLDKGKISRTTYDACDLIYKKLRKEYDVIFYTSPEDVKLVNDGERSVDKYFREDIIGLFDMYLQYNIIEDGPRVVCLEGSVKERLETIKSTLESYNVDIKI
jgi:nicotinamide riboside kinase|tara:strand:+ start:41 stop:637 length:597 start_codon:yes stop_codon:yes gene_type:complete